MTKQTPHVKTTDEQRRTATEEPPWNGQSDNYWVGAKPALLSRNLTLNSNASLNYKHIYGPRNGPLPHL